jgi:hypothetical protein
VSGGDLSGFLIGFVSGAVVFWQLSRVSERFRRARRDLRAARKGIRTLIEMVISRGWQAVKLWLLVTAVLGVVVAAWLGSRSGK